MRLAGDLHMCELLARLGVTILKLLPSTRQADRQLYNNAVYYQIKCEEIIIRKKMYSCDIECVPEAIKIRWWSSCEKHLGACVFGLIYLFIVLLTHVGSCLCRLQLHCDPSRSGPFYVFDMGGPGWTRVLRIMVFQ